MNADIKAKWVAALRSGKYTQITGQLADGRGGYCCLGVLCDISGLGKWDGEDEDCFFEAANYRDDGLPPLAVADWAGFAVSQLYPTIGARIPRVVIDGDTFRLDEQNDTGKTFAQIAAAIEEQL